MYTYLYDELHSELFLILPCPVVLLMWNYIEYKRLKYEYHSYFIFYKSAKLKAKQYMILNTREVFQI